MQNVEFVINNFPSGDYISGLEFALKNEAGDDYVLN